MTEPDPHKPQPQSQQDGAPDPSGGARRRGQRIHRSRRRPSTQPARKPVVVIPQGSTIAPGNDQQQQSLGVEIRPIGGIFGTSSSLEVPEEDRRRLLRVPKSLRRRRDTQEREASLLQDPDFRMLWLSRLLSQTAQGALLYALLILVVDLSNRSFYNSLFVACSNIPSIAFGLPAGLVVDTISRKHLLVLLNGFRFLFMLFLVGSAPSLAGVFAATLGIWIIHQFYSPSEASMLADLVPPSRYTSAQAMFNLALTISQAVGLVLLAPLMLRLGGPELVFVVAGALWCIAGALTLLLPSIPIDQSATRRPRRRGLRESLGDGWRFVRGDRQTFEAIVDDVVVSVGMSALVVIIPFYLERVLGTSKENTVFVFAPAALGLVIGLRMAPLLSRIIGERYAASLSLVVFAFCVGSLGFVEQTYRFLNETLRFPLDRITDALSISPLIFVAMLISIPAGMASSIVNVAARSILLQRSPANVRGQVIATQGLIGNVFGLVPTLLAGVATDIFGVVPVAVAIGVLIVMAAGLANGIGRRSAPVVPAPLT
jgi:MFS family permease